MSRTLRMTRRNFCAMLAASIPMASIDALPLIDLKKIEEKLCFSGADTARQEPMRIIFVHCDTTGWLTMPLIVDANLHLHAELIDSEIHYVSTDWWRDCDEISRYLDPLLSWPSPWVILTIDLDEKCAVSTAIEAIDFFKFRNGLKVGVLASSHPKNLWKHEKHLRALTDMLCEEVVEVVIPTAQRIAEDRIFGEEHCTASFAIADHIDSHSLYDVFEHRWKGRA
jgi:hypothetical protein